MSAAGILVSAADRLDSLVGLVAVGCAPSGGADPFGLRRIAYGLLETLVANQQRLDLPAAVQEAAGLLQVEVSQQSQVKSPYMSLMNWQDAVILHCCCQGLSDCFRCSITAHLQILDRMNFFIHATGKNPFESARCCKAWLLVVCR